MKENPPKEYLAAKILIDLLKICTKNEIEFNLLKEGDTNHVDFNLEEKRLVLNLPDYDSEELNDILTSQLKELKQLFE